MIGLDDGSLTTTELGNASSGAVSVHRKGVVEQPWFEPLMPSVMDDGRSYFRAVPVPSYRFVALR
jgi:hypothetical protein